MAVPLKTRLKAKAKMLGISGYEKMDEAALKAAIEKKNSAAKPAAKKPAAKPRTTKTAPKKTTAKKPLAKKVSAATIKGKSAAKPPAKSKAQKSSPKGKAAQGTAKRAPAKSKTAPKTTARKSRKTPADVVVRSYEGGRVGEGGYTNLDVANIDWNRPTRVGRDGKRKDVMDGLRRHKGDYLKVFLDLRENALGYYPNALNAFPRYGKDKRAAAEHQLRWLIARVALDYATKTYQHEGKRAQRKDGRFSPDGKSKTARKSKSSPARKTKSTTASKSRSKSKTATKSTKSKRAPKKAAQRSTGGSKRGVYAKR